MKYRLCHKERSIVSYFQGIPKSKYSQSNNPIYITTIIIIAVMWYCIMRVIYNTCTIHVFVLFVQISIYSIFPQVNTTVHNIIVGKLWIDNHGEMDIINHTTGEKCHLIYKPYSYFSREAPRRVRTFAFVGMHYAHIHVHMQCTCVLYFFPCYKHKVRDEVQSNWSNRLL